MNHGPDHRLDRDDALLVAITESPRDDQTRRNFLGDAMGVMIVMMTATIDQNMIRRTNVVGAVLNPPRMPEQFTEADLLSNEGRQGLLRSVGVSIAVCVSLIASAAIALDIVPSSFSKVLLSSSDLVPFYSSTWLKKEAAKLCCRLLSANLLSRAACKTCAFKRANVVE